MNVRNSSLAQPNAGREAVEGGSHSSHPDGSCCSGPGCRPAQCSTLLSVPEHAKRAQHTWSSWPSSPGRRTAGWSWWLGPRLPWVRSSYTPLTSRSPGGTAAQEGTGYLYRGEGRQGVVGSVAAGLLAGWLLPHTATNKQPCGDRTPQPASQPAHWAPTLVKGVGAVLLS